ncbi:ABC transporter permease [Spirosoma sp. KNUC1025]|uniref:ABC transporter permease n=1 Tax=Spirosoma sp. KNUC1025 TaxID=2894082 RepID=UPI001E2B9FD1|nr:ABC transporter permease [Spirosoma sp. KNUC1025]UFH57630.1 ABC transporter permease [Spirosoma sp. KNUC1025]
MNAATDLINCLGMERLKLKGTLVIWLAIFAPGFVVVVAFVAGYADGERFYQPGVNPWNNFCEHLLAGWSLFIFPLYISLLSALYAALEHQNRAWGYLYSLPVLKSSIYLSKLLVLTALIVLSHTALFVLGFCAGSLIGLLKPAFGFQNYAMSAFMPVACLHLFVCGLGMIVIQLLISLWYPSFIIPAGFGLFATLAGAIARSFQVSHFSPYLWPFVFLNNTLGVNNWNYAILGWSVCTYLLGAYISMFFLGRRSRV